MPPADGLLDGDCLLWTDLVDPAGPEDNLLKAYDEINRMVQYGVDPTRLAFLGCARVDAATR